MEGVWRKGVSKSHLREVSASKMPSTKFCEGLLDFVAINSPKWPTIQKTRVNEQPQVLQMPRAFHDVSRILFAKLLLRTTHPFASENLK